MPTFTAYAINAKGHVREITTVDSPNIVKARDEIARQLKLEDGEMFLGGIHTVWSKPESTQGNAQHIH